MQHTPVTPPGYTLIELLATISIIGLLSTLALVSLNESRLKAINSKKLSDIKNYVTAIETYRTSNSGYPDPGDTTWRCLGDYEDNACWANNNRSENATLNAILAEVVPDLPTIGPDGVNTCLEDSWEGAVYRCTDRTGSICHDYEINWYMEKVGNDCGIGTGTEQYFPAADTYCTPCSYSSS